MKRLFYLSVLLLSCLSSTRAMNFNTSKEIAVQIIRTIGRQSQLGARHIVMPIAQTFVDNPVTTLLTGFCLWTACESIKKGHSNKDNTFVSWMHSIFNDDKVVFFGTAAAALVLNRVYNIIN